MTATVLQAPPAVHRANASTRTHASAAARSRLADHLATIAGSVAQPLSVTWLAETRLTAGFGWLGFLVVAYVLFLALFALATSERHGRLVAIDRVVSCRRRHWHGSAPGAPRLLIGYVAVKGLPYLQLPVPDHHHQRIWATDPATRGAPHTPSSAASSR